MNSTTRAVSAALIAGGILLLAGCGNDGEAAADDGTQAVETEETDTPTPSPATPTEIPPTPTEAPADELAPDPVAVALQFLAHYEAGEYQEFVDLMAPELREQLFGPVTVAQFWTFNSQFHAEPDVPTVCEANDSNVACDWRGQDDVSRELGYQLQTEWSFTIEDGVITQIDYFANDNEVFGPVNEYVRATYPGELGCGSDHPDEPEFEPGALTGPDGSAFLQHCATKMAKYAAEFGETDAYVPPTEKA